MYSRVTKQATNYPPAGTVGLGETRMMRLLVKVKDLTDLTCAPKTQALWSTFSVRVILCALVTVIQLALQLRKEEAVILEV
jgi:hypothetical protein